jgi:hypothetical protein
VRDPEVIKFFIMWQSLSLWLTGYAWFRQVTSRSLLKWSVGGHAWHLPLRAAGHDTPLARAICFLVIVIVIVGHGHNPLRAMLTPLLTTLGAPLGISDGAGLLLPMVASLLLGTGRSSATSLSVSYWAVTLHNFSVMYLKTTSELRRAAVVVRHARCF